MADYLAAWGRLAQEQGCACSSASRAEGPLLGRLERLQLESEATAINHTGWRQRSCFAAGQPSRTSTSISPWCSAAISCRLEGSGDSSLPCSHPSVNELPHLSYETLLPPLVPLPG